MEAQKEVAEDFERSEKRRRLTERRIPPLSIL